MELTTERLELRFPTVKDAEAVFAAYATDPEVTRYMTWRPHESIEVTREFLSGREVANAAGKDLAWMAWAGDQLASPRSPSWRIQKFPGPSMPPRRRC